MCTACRLQVCADLYALAALWIVPLLPSSLRRKLPICSLGIAVGRIRGHSRGRLRPRSCRLPWPKGRRIGPARVAAVASGLAGVLPAAVEPSPRSLDVRSRHRTPGKPGLYRPSKEASPGLTHCGYVTRTPPEDLPNPLACRAFSFPQAPFVGQLGHQVKPFMKTRQKRNPCKPRAF